MPGLCYQVTKILKMPCNEDNLLNEIYQIYFTFHKFSITKLLSHQYHSKSDLYRETFKMI